VALWVVAVVGALVMVVGPLTPWVLGVEIAGLALCLSATVALVVWFVRR
jgi:hypothetical protein